MNREQQLNIDLIRLKQEFQRYDNLKFVDPYAWHKANDLKLDINRVQKELMDIRRNLL